MKPKTTFVPTKSLLFTIFICFLLSGNHLFSQATSVRNNVTFSWADTQTNLSDPATIQSITIDGNVYSTFVVPSNYDLTRLGPGGHGGNHINQNGTQIAGSSNIPTWTTQALDAYQSINLNHYFESNSNGDNFCNNYSAVATTDTQIQTISYSPGIPSNPDGILAVTERGGNNCFYIEVWGTPVGGGSEQQLGQTFVRNETNLTGVLPPAPPTTNSDYWRSGRNNENGQVIGVALYKLSDLAPTGSTVTSIRYYAATNDNGDGKFFLMQTYAQDDSFNPDFEDVFNGDVGANDNVPDGSSYSYFTNVDPLNGTVVVNTDGTFTYTPDPGFTGTDTFEVQVCLPAPNQNVCDTSTVTLNVKSGVSIDNASADEGDNLAFTITINDPIGEDVEFDINYTDNSTTTADYSGPATVTLPANANSVSFNVAALNDNWLEGDQTFNAIISNPSNIVTITDDNGLGTIIDTDEATVTTGNYDVDEDAGIIQLRVWLNESGSGVEGAFTVDVAINSSAISFPATDGSDFNATTATLSFPANSIPGTEFFVPLAIIDDNIVEPSEQVIQRLSNVSFNEIGLAGPGGIVRIHDNDTATVTLEDITVNEAIGTVDYGFTLSGTTQDAFTIDFATGDVSAVNPEDYASSTGNVTFTGTNNEIQVTTLTINDDVIVEPAEDFSVTGSYTAAAPGFTNAQAQDIILANNPGTVTITDNDGGSGIGVVVDDFTVDENDGTATFDVVLNRAVQGGFSVNYSITDGTAISPDDYTVTSNTGLLNFTGNNNETQSVTVNLVNDGIIEGSENLFIELSGLSTNLINIVDGNATGTINDDDIAGPTEGLYVVDNTVNEADGTVTVTVRLEGTFAPFSISYSTVDGTALDGQDYTTTSGTLNFDGNDTEVETFTVAITNDNIIEAVESFFANIASAPVYVPIRDAQGSIEINDDDNNGTVGVAFDSTDITVTEGVGVQAVFPVSFNGNIANGEQVSVDYTTVQGTALDGNDFT
ncbi:Calx-beta domain-containing protein, partial [uncultured Croceitalea sp.]|uniref:Calx-beta domain-containing protein n=1 Tax=uncultured Croceitalea sp. TaxID=1798908 RepID=UPI003306297B